MGQGWKVQQIFNVNFVASEILNVFVGSFGLVAVAPLTAIAGAVMYSRKHRYNKSSETTVSRRSKCPTTLNFIINSCGDFANGCPKNE